MEEKHEIKNKKFPKQKLLPTYVNYLPRGFVTYDQMVARVAQRKQTTNDVFTESTFVSSLEPIWFPKKFYKLCQTEASEGQKESRIKSLQSSQSITSTIDQVQCFEKPRHNMFKREHSIFKTKRLPLALTSGQNVSLIDNGLLSVTKSNEWDCTENDVERLTSDGFEIKQIESKDKMDKSYNSSSLKIPSKVIHSKIQNDRSGEGDKIQVEDAFINVVHTARTPTAENMISIVIMNVSGPDDKRGSVPSRRRHVIQSIIKRHRPSLVLFQEFKWKGIIGKIWDPSPLPDIYEYCGHSEASIMYNSARVEATNLSVNLRIVLEWLQRSSNNGLHKVFPLDFDPISRLYPRVLTYFGGKVVRFVCISWHGPYNRKSVAERVSYFEYLMEYFKQIYKKIKLPILIAGDFNVSIDAIENLVEVPFQLYRYAPSKRRQTVIDYFITTSELALFGISPIDLRYESRDCASNEIFDHDPVMASMDQLGEQNTKCV